jgi:signal transduction histidine kinase
LKKGCFVLNLVAGLLLAGLSLVGFTLLSRRPGLPPSVDRSTLLEVDSRRLRDPDDLDFFLRSKTVGERVTVGLRADGGVRELTVVLVPYYRHASFPVIYLVIGLINLSIGLAVFVLKPGDALARVFYWAMVSFSYAVIVSGEFYAAGRGLVSLAPGFVYNLLYPLAPALMLHFVLALSGPLHKLERLLVYGPALALGGVIDGFFLASALNGSIEDYRLEIRAVYALRWYVVAAAGAALVLLVLRLRKADRAEEKAQVQWILLGLVAGLLPFLALYQLPRVLGVRPVVSEELSSVFYILIPLALAVSIIQYKLMNIEFIVNRSLVYSILTVLGVSLYLLVLEGARLAFAGFVTSHQTLVPLAAAVVLAVAFQPARRRVQAVVDKTFFRQGYDARQAALGFSEQASGLVEVERLADLFQARLAAVLPTEEFRMGIFDSRGLRLRRGAESGLRSLVERFSPGGGAQARRPAVRFDSDLDFSAEELLERSGVDLAVRLPLGSSPWRGVLALGRKKSGQRFSYEDFQLVRALLAELSLHLERVRLQEEVIYERASREKLDELNRLKTEFISSVSHELRTPLSSLRGLVEILQSGRLRTGARRDRVLGLMAGETGRLSRLLHNILDYGKIEQGARTYDLREAPVQDIVTEVVQLFRASGEAEGFTLRTVQPRRPVILRLDRDAVEEALINLLDNAIKYSINKKRVEIRLVSRPDEVRVEVKDWGIGLSPEERSKVFETFYRSPAGCRANPRGVGLGLKIVKHIMDGHGGAVRVESSPGRGSVFTLAFPRP